MERLTEVGSDAEERAYKVQRVREVVVRPELVGLTWSFIDGCWELDLRHRSHLQDEDTLGISEFERNPKTGRVRIPLDIIQEAICELEAVGEVPEPLSAPFIGIVRDAS